jgi:hypothetical protein
MDFVFNSTNWLLLITFFATTSYAYWLIGEAEKQSRKHRG